MKLPGKLGFIDWSEWLGGLFSAIISGGASAVVSGFAVTSSDPEHFPLYSGVSLMVMVKVFGVSAILSGMLFLRSKPLPDFHQITMSDSPDSPISAQIREADRKQLQSDPVPVIEVKIK